MSRIDPTFYEAARIDGATKLTQIRTITLPLLTPIISLNLILNVSGILGSNLDQTLVLMNSQNQNKSEVINSFVYKMGLTQGDFSYATAVWLGNSNHFCHSSSHHRSCDTQIEQWQFSYLIGGVTK